MKFSRSLPALCHTVGQPSTGHLTNWSTLGKDTRYVAGPSPVSSTPLDWGTQERDQHFCMEVPDEPHHWHVHSTHVEAGHRLTSLLEHCYPRPEVPEHEIFPQPPRTLSHRRATQYRASYQLEYPGEGHKICGWSLSCLVNPPRLGDTYSILTQRVLFEVRLCDHNSALDATYPPTYPR